MKRKQPAMTIQEVAWPKGMNDGPTSSAAVAAYPMDSTATNGTTLKASTIFMMLRPKRKMMEPAPTASANILRMLSHVTYPAAICSAVRSLQGVELPVREKMSVMRSPESRD